ncbi:hypothetical protein ACOMHN_047628 [Nucella lapillus]
MRGMLWPAQVVRVLVFRLLKSGGGVPFLINGRPLNNRGACPLVPVMSMTDRRGTVGSTCRAWEVPICLLR